MTRLTIHVPGRPIGQGNIRHLGKGRPAIHQNAKTLLPWRADIADAAAKAMADAGFTEPFDGPLMLDPIVFLMPRGKTVRRAQPTVPPDLDHLLRALGDALTRAGAIADDARIVRIRDLQKSYEHPGCGPGVFFTLTTAEEPPSCPTCPAR